MWCVRPLAAPPSLIRWPLSSECEDGIYRRKGLPGTVAAVDLEGEGDGVPVTLLGHLSAEVAAEDVVERCS